MPHQGLRKLGRTNRIYDYHIDQFVDALENTYTADELPPVFTFLGQSTDTSGRPATASDGELWVVGTGEDATNYVWHGGAWRNFGPVGGPKGDKGDTGAQGPRGVGTAEVYVQTTEPTPLGDGAIWINPEGDPDDPGAGGSGAVDSVNGQTGDVVLTAADVDALPDTTVIPDGLPTVLSTAWGDQREYPRLVKPLAAPILTYGMQSATSVYVPSLVDRRPMGGSGVSLIYSTDHGGAGGIYGLHADSPLGTWTDDGLLYVDGIEGTQTETPAVIWNEKTSLYHVYYHQRGDGTPGSEPWTGLGNQSTFLATTPDLVTFTRVGRVLDVIAQTEAGDGHTGYFRPLRVGDTWYGFSLYGGHDQPRWGQWQSTDGLTWHQHPHRLGHHTPQITHIDDVTTTNRLTIGANVLQWRGRWWQFSIASFGSGGGIRPGVVLASPLSDDLREFAGRPVELALASQAWEGPGINQLGAPIAWDGHVYLTYRAGDDASANVGIGLLEVV